VLSAFYNGLEISINKRFARGFSVLESYTWSKNIDYISGNNDLEDSTIQDPFNFNHSRGVADSDHPQRPCNSFSQYACRNARWHPCRCYDLEYDGRNSRHME